VRFLGEVSASPLYRALEYRGSVEKESSMGNMLMLIFSPVLVLFQIITVAAMFGLICLGVTVWMPFGLLAGGEMSLLGFGIYWLVIVVSVFVANLLHESCNEEIVFKVGVGFWVAFFLLACLVSGISRSLGA
jgi:hypothetical protein